MSASVIASFIALGLTVAGMLVQLGALLQRVRVLENEKACDKPDACPVNLELRSLSQRVGQLEIERREQAEQVLQLRVEMRGLKEAMTNLKEALQSYERAIRQAV